MDIASTSHPLFLFIFWYPKAVLSSEVQKRWCKNGTQTCPIAVALKRRLPLLNLSFNSENENALSPFNVTSHWLGEKINGARAAKADSDKAQESWSGVRWVYAVVSVMCDVVMWGQSRNIYIYTYAHISNLAWRKLHCNLPYIIVMFSGLTLL